MNTNTVTPEIYPVGIAQGEESLSKKTGQYRGRDVEISNEPAREMVRPTASEDPLQTKTDDNSAGLGNFTPELLAKIFNYTTLRDRAIIQQTCKRFYHVAKLRKVLYQQSINTYPEAANSRESVCDNPRLIGLLKEKTGYDLTGKPVIQGLLARFLKIGPENCTHILKREGYWVETAIHLKDDMLACAYNDGLLKVWDMNRASGEPCTHTLKGHSSRVADIIYLTDFPGDSDSLLVSAATDKTIKIWDLNRAEGECCIHTLEGHEDYVNDVIQLDHRLVSASEDCTLKVWDLSLPEKPRCTHTLKGHEQGVSGIKHFYGSRFISHSIDGMIKLWDANRVEAESCILTESVSAPFVPLRIALFPNDSKRVVCYSGSFGPLKIFDLTLPEGQRCIDIENEWYVRHILNVRSNRVACPSIDGSIRLCDFGLCRSTGVFCTHRLQGHNKSVAWCTLFPDGRLLSVSSDMTMKLWDADLPEKECCTHTMEVHSKYARKVIRLLSGRVVFAPHGDAVTVWDY